MFFFSSYSCKNFWSQSSWCRIFFFFFFCIIICAAISCRRLWFFSRDCLLGLHKGHGWMDELNGATKWLLFLKPMEVFPHICTVYNVIKIKTGYTKTCVLIFSVAQFGLHLWHLSSKCAKVSVEVETSLILEIFCLTSSLG